MNTNRSRRPIRDILALAVVALCILVVLAALFHPGAGFEGLLLPTVGMVVAVIAYYFRQQS